MKRCGRCLVEKPDSEFHKKVASRDGLNWMCRPCNCAHATKYRRASLELYRARDKDRYRSTPGRRAASLERSIAQRKHSPDSVRRYKREWEKRNPHVQTEKNRIRGIAAHRARSPWRNRFFVSEIYALARLRTRILGFKWHVDHIVPLRHPLVCGLHNEFNLRAIPAVENIAKGNRSWPNMPDQ